MRWRFLTSITEIEAPRRIVGTASTDLPAELFADHFPSFPVVPGVLVIEMCAQLAGRLVEISASAARKRLILPFLTIVSDSKLHRFVAPSQTLVIEATLEDMHEESALCSAIVRLHGTRVATARLLFAFHPDGEAGPADRDAIERYERAEFLRLGLTGFPPGPVSVATPV